MIPRHQEIRDATYWYRVRITLADRCISHPFAGSSPWSVTCLARRMFPAAVAIEVI